MYVCMCDNQLLNFKFYFTYSSVSKKVFYCPGNLTFIFNNISEADDGLSFDRINNVDEIERERDGVLLCERLRRFRRPKPKHFPRPPRPTRIPKPRRLSRPPRPTRIPKPTHLQRPPRPTCEYLIAELGRQGRYLLSRRIPNTRSALCKDSGPGSQ